MLQDTFAPWGCQAVACIIERLYPSIVSGSSAAKELLEKNRKQRQDIIGMGR
jgi:hypothetical protein